MVQVLDADGEMAKQYDFKAVEEDLYKYVRRFFLMCII